MNLRTPDHRRDADPSDLTPRLFPFEADPNWFESYWYGDAAEKQPGLLRRALEAAGAGVVAALRAATTHWRATGAHAGHGPRHSLTA